MTIRKKSFGISPSLDASCYLKFPQPVIQAIDSWPEFEPCVACVLDAERKLEEARGDEDH
jgi:hypothetical protein